MINETLARTSGFTSCVPASGIYHSKRVYPSSLQMTSLSISPLKEDACHTQIPLHNYSAQSPNGWVASYKSSSQMTISTPTKPGKGSTKVLYTELPSHLATSVNRTSGMRCSKVLRRARSSYTRRTKWALFAKVPCTQLFQNLAAYSWPENI